jgi:hypothetical protein
MINRSFAADVNISGRIIDSKRRSERMLRHTLILGFVIPAQAGMESKPCFHC